MTNTLFPLCVVRICCVVIITSCDVGEGLYWQSTKRAAQASALLVSHQDTTVPESLPPSQLVGALTNTVPDDRDLRWYLQYTIGMLV